MYPCTRCSQTCHGPPSSDVLLWQNRVLFQPTRASPAHVLASKALKVAAGTAPLSNVLEGAKAGAVGGLQSRLNAVRAALARAWSCRYNPVKISRTVSAVCQLS
eukprot:4428433-Pleurochrysis_carterae.AAC.1